VSIENLFRAEALPGRGEPDLGSVLRLSRWWLPASFWILLIAALAAGGLAAMGSWPVHETGIGVIRSGAADIRGTVVNCSIDDLKLSQPRAPASDPSTGLTFIALVDGNSRPKLTSGMQVVLSVSGYPDAAVVATLDQFGDRLLTAADARPALELLGADASALSPTLVPICGRLDSARLVSGGEEYQLKHGMLARARVMVRNERPLSWLFARTR